MDSTERANKANSEVNHPDHYNWVPGVECWQVVRWFSFNCGGAIKYIWRAGKKSPDAVTDLRKAVNCLLDEIARLEGGINGG